MRAKKNRNLKVVRAFSARTIPYIPLLGRWLEKAGFEIGMRVDVEVRPRCLVIRPVKLREK
jgi:hypothetical protein